ncbi:hypothetical protein [Neptunomonas sp.]
MADIAVFPYVALAHEGGIDLAAYTSVLKWFERIKALDNFIPMSGVWRR